MQYGAYLVWIACGDLAMVPQMREILLSEKEGDIENQLEKFSVRIIQRIAGTFQLGEGAKN